MSSEHIDLPSYSCDLIVAASSVHWFDLDAFYAECKRLLKPDGRIAVWTYTWPDCNNKSLNEQLELIKKDLGPFWTKESLLHLNHYKELLFPFSMIKSPSFHFSVKWDIDQLLNFLSTWACIKNYIIEYDKNFIQNAHQKLSAFFEKDEKFLFYFPLYMKCGKL